MSSVTVTNCDMCGIAKAPTSAKWFKIWIDHDIFKCCVYLLNIKELECASGALDCCGLACATKFFQRFLSHGTLL